MPNRFSFVLCATLAGRSVQSCEKRLFFSVFNHLGPFTQLFQQLKECLVLEFHEMIRVPHAVVCQRICDIGQELGVLKVSLF